MGTVLDILMGDTDTLDEKDFESFDYRRTELNPESALTVRTASIATKSDLLQVEKAIRSGNIVITDVESLGTGLKKDEVVSFLASTVEDVDGDITWRSSAESELIASPSGVNISRDSLTES